MFVAETTVGVRYCSFEEEEAFLRKASAEHRLHCPDCKGKVIFRAGSRTPHFAHMRECNNPNRYTEPESLTHRTGKRHLYERLKTLYPSSEVLLEYYLIETKQRADVMVIHENGERWAFEYQCSKIPGYVWEDRHQLYETINVKDFWILDGSMIRENDRYYQINGLESNIFKKTDYLIYYSPDQTMITLHWGGNNYGTEINPNFTFQEMLEKCFIDLSVLPCLSSLMMIKKNQDYERAKNIRRLEYEREKQKYQEEDLARERRKTFEKDKTKKSLNEKYIEIRNNRINLTRNMTTNEKQLFKQLCEKYLIEEENFPGFCLSEVEYSDLILTPPALWQLWVCDYLFTGYKIRKKKGKDTTIWTDYLKEKFCELRKHNILRVKSSSERHENYIFTLYAFLTLLCSVGIISRLGISTGKFYRINTDVLPVIVGHEENVFIQMYYEGFQHEKINKMMTLYKDHINYALATKS
ncbi:competence protein CoiA [Paenibacillus sp. An7]|uniref:competence protein CoiA n=1 Tax=Paenibacillus sp. An7 TaxID=2689577 RepID=UPI00135C6B93|nr:competence protein CoiA family protein [Paenibacillus sp. An7]